MSWHGEPIDDLKVKVPKSIPKYTDDYAIEKVRAAIENKKTLKAALPGTSFTFDWNVG